MIKNIVFDIGNVLSDYNVTGFLAGKGFGPAMIKRIVKASLMSPVWEEFERGDMTEAEAMAAFVRLDPEIEAELNTAYENVKGMLTLRPFAVDWVKSLKAEGYGVYYLSNYSGKAYKDCSDSLAFMEYMDGGCISFRERVTKPDPGIYKRFLEKYGLAAEECLFIDDTPENVEAAVRLGFRGLVFESYEKTAEYIRGLKSAAFRPVRKKRNEIPAEEAEKLLGEERRGVLAVNGCEGYPYAVPVNYYYDKAAGKIFFHGSRAGHKAEALKNCDKVCFTVYGHETVKDEAWAPYLRSAVVFGRCRPVEDTEELYTRLRQFAGKYYPDKETMEQEIAASGKAVRMYEITIEHLSGKEVQER